MKANGSITADALDAHKESLAARFAIRSELASIRQVAQILGLNAKSIARRVRAGSFPIEHRRMGRAVLFKLEDVARWLAEDRKGAGTPRPAVDASGPDEGNARTLPLNLVEAIVRHAAISADETPKQRAERISQKIMAEMANQRRRGEGLDGKKRRPEGRRH